MALKDDVLAALKGTGTQLKKDIWHPEDTKTLALIASDLVGLNKKVGQAKTEADRRKYRKAATRLVDHAALIALSRLNVAQREVAAALRNFFLKLASEWMAQLLGKLHA